MTAADARLLALIESACEAFALDLTGIGVLTEAASGAFACTPLLAAAAGAEVYAAGRDSVYGSRQEVNTRIETLAARLGVRERIQFTGTPALDVAAQVSLVTNLGFVRPISRALIARLRPDAAISLMWEGWEFRAADIDLAAAADHAVPVVGTREDDARVETMKFLGPLACKLLFECDVEVVAARVLVVGSAPFGTAIARYLEACGAAEVTLVDGWKGPERPGLTDYDAMVVAEHRSERPVIGPGGLFPEAAFSGWAGRIIHISGVVDGEILGRAGLEKWPVRAVPPRTMTVTTAYVGPRPVVNLHAAGLKVGGILVRARRSGADSAQAERAALDSGLGSAISRSQPISAEAGA